MLSIDTNLIVRYLTKDNPNEAAQAKALIDNEKIYVCRTVLLETECVLRSVYGYTAVQISRSLRYFSGLRNVMIEDARFVSQAFDWMEGGMDFADALHLAATAECESFVSFDRRLSRIATKLGAGRVRTP